jgi:ferredoxin
MHIVANNSEFDTDENSALLSALQQQGICARFSCRNGNCGLCEAILNTGRVWLDDRRQHIDAPAAILLCRAFARSDLRLSVNAAPRAVSRYCRVLRCEKTVHGHEVELRLPTGRMPPLSSTDVVCVDGCRECRPVMPVHVDLVARVMILQLREDDADWLDAVRMGEVRILMPAS